ncbi:hypothetical protein [Alcaligenes sp. WGS1538]
MQQPVLIDTTQTAAMQGGLHASALALLLENARPARTKPQD